MALVDRTRQLQEGRGGKAHFEPIQHMEDTDIHPPMTAVAISAKEAMG